MKIPGTTSKCGVADVDVTLVQDGAPTLLPMQGRSACIHVSDVIRDLCVQLGHFSDDRDMNMAQLELGCAFEHAIISRYALHDPARYTQPGEIMVDGLPGTPDLFDVVDYMPHEIKCTWMSTKRAPGDEKFWKYEVQLKAYCYMLGANVAKLHVCYVNGDYKNSGPVYRVWQYTWTDNELAENWMMLKSRRDSMKLELDKEVSDATANVWTE